MMNFPTEQQKERLQAGLAAYPGEACLLPSYRRLRRAVHCCMFPYVPGLRHGGHQEASRNSVNHGYLRVSGTTKSCPAIPLPTLEMDEKQKARDKRSSVTDKTWERCLTCAAATDCLEFVSLTLSALPQQGQAVSGKLTRRQRADRNAPPGAGRGGREEGWKLGTLRTSSPRPLHTRHNPSQEKG